MNNPHGAIDRASRQSVTLQKKFCKVFFVQRKPPAGGYDLLFTSFEKYKFQIFVADGQENLLRRVDAILFQLLVQPC